MARRSFQSWPVSDHGGSFGSTALPPTCKRLQGATDARNRPASYSPLCKQADDKADAVSCDLLPWPGTIGLLNQAGFSLIEMIMVLVLLGIMGVGAGLGLSSVIDGFMMSRESAATVTKGQLALLRLTRELRVITKVISASASSIQFTALHGEGLSQTYTVSQSNEAITLNDGVNNDILADQVNSLALAYYDSYGGSAQTTWTSARKIIQLTIVMNGPDGTTFSFQTRIMPRNI